MNKIKDRFNKYSDATIKFSMYGLLLISIVVNAISIFLGKGVLNLNITIVSLFFIIAYKLFNKIYKQKLSYIQPIYFYVTMFFGYLSLFLGSFLNFYEKFEWWDTLLHFSSGILIGFVCIVLVAVFIARLFDHVDSKHDIIFIICVGILSSMAFAIFWEFYEFAFDYFADGNMQRSIIIDSTKSLESQLAQHIRPSGRFIDPGLKDTIKDMFLATVGAFIAGAIAYPMLNKSLRENIEAGIVVPSDDNVKFNK